MGRCVDRQHPGGARRARQPHRQRHAQVGIGKRLAADGDRGELPFDGTGRLHRQAGMAAVEAQHRAVTQALHGTQHRGGQGLQRPAVHRLLHPAGQAGGGQALLAAWRPAHQFPGLQAECGALDVGRRHAGRTQRAHQRAHRRADDHVRLQPQFLQRLDHAHMHEAARSARAEHPGHPRRAGQRRGLGGVEAGVVLLGLQRTAGQQQAARAQRCGALQPAAPGGVDQGLAAARAAATRRASSSPLA